jgi:16S rRNA (guanine527-N7)-methyltransferase
MEHKRLLVDGAGSLGISLSEYQIQLFYQYMDTLLSWNAKMNLTAITDRADIVTKHFLDSLTVLRFLPGEGVVSVVDVGAGAGFPSFPLKIAAPRLAVTALDATHKRVRFLDAVSRELGLEIHCVWGRAEQLAKTAEYRGSYDAVVARAVANLSSLAEYCLPFIKVGGKFVSMKGYDVDAEINDAKSVINKLGGEVSDITEIRIPFTDINHKLVVISKLRETPAIFPRNTIKTAKSPKK